MSEHERWGSIATGAALTIYGVTRRRPSGWILAGFGVLLFRRGLTGFCHTYDLLGMSSEKQSDMLPPHGDPLIDQLR